jgi:hypothetical protein
LTRFQHAWDRSRVNDDTAAMVAWLLLVVVIVITPAGITAYLARRKGLNAWAWFVLGLVLPWAPLFMVVVKRRREDPRRKVFCENCGAAVRYPIPVGWTSASS